jgi:hypothetical protein
MPPHIYGELTRTMEGCEIIAKRKVVTDLLSRVHQLFNVCTMLPPSGRTGSSSAGSASSDSQNNRAEIAAAYQDLQGALWALGHIASNELGAALVFEADRKFVGWCIENVYSCAYYSLRGTFFYVLGLISRTQQGSRKLLKYGWDSAPRNTNSAVAFPLRASNMFRAMSGPVTSATPRGGQGSPHTKFPFNSAPPTSPTSRGTSGGAFTAPSSTATSTGPTGLTISTAGAAGALAQRNCAMSPSNMGVLSPVRMNTLSENVLSHLSVYHRTGAAAAKNIEIEVLYIIAKVKPPIGCLFTWFLISFVNISAVCTSRLYSFALNPETTTSSFFRSCCSCPA